MLLCANRSYITLQYIYLTVHDVWSVGIYAYRSVHCDGRGHISAHLLSRPTHNCLYSSKLKKVVYIHVFALSAASASVCSLLFVSYLIKVVYSFASVFCKWLFSLFFFFFPLRKWYIEPLLCKCLFLFLQVAFFLFFFFFPPQKVVSHAHA